MKKEGKYAGNRLEVDCTAQLTKENAPVPSIIFDGLGLLTAGNLFEAAKSALSIIDTAKKLMS